MGHCFEIMFRIGWAGLKCYYKEYKVLFGESENIGLQENGLLQYGALDIDVVLQISENALYAHVT